MAINSGNIVDEDAEHSDWIEIYNNSDQNIDLKGWFLSDNPSNLKEWQFPDYTLNKGAYLLLFASGKNRTDPTKNLHTNFKLSGSGEFLAISEPDSTISYAFNPLFPAQQQDISYGVYQGQLVFFNNPTPGLENTASNIPFSPVFNFKRGFYTSPVDVTLTNPGLDGKIYYTLNGTRPNKTEGILYSSPIHISTTTPLSAVVVNSTNASSPVVSNTYIFLNDVIKQPKAPTGYPTDWKESTATTSIPADYEMDARITTATAYKDLILPSLKSLPTMSIVTNTGYLFSNIENTETGGIYIFTGSIDKTNKTWERPASVEYFDPATGKELQINCRLKLHGGNSRVPTNCPKHGFEIAFKSLYGPSKLNFDIFNEKNSAKEFNSLILRAGYNYTWVKNSALQQTAAQYIQDSWAKTTQLEMNDPSAHETFIHLYINGLYWGVYNISEQLDKDFMETYLNGTNTEFDVIKEKETDATGSTDGNMIAWDSLKNNILKSDISEIYLKIQGKNPDGTTNPQFQNLLDVVNYIDYMLINYYIGNGDWDANNWTAGRNRIKNNEGFKFFVWDAETTMTSLTENKIITGTAGNPTAFMQYLKKNSDFKVLIADRIKKMLMDAGGQLTPTIAADRYQKLADEIELSMVAESARWSDWYAPYTPFTLYDHWLPRKNDLLENYFPQRTDVLISQLKVAGLYPGIDAPVFTHNGGKISTAIQLGISSDAGIIYYTTDGTDPRTAIKGTIATAAKPYNSLIGINQNVTIKARVKTSNEWSAMTEASFEWVSTSAVSLPLADVLNCRIAPNPFRETVKILFNLPYAGDVKIDIYTIDGKLIEKLESSKLYSGENQAIWSPKDNQKGIFICHICFGKESTYLKLIRN